MVRLEGAVWRGALVALLALTAFVLVLYNRRLATRTRNVRRLLLALRGASLILLACALTGARVEYDRPASKSVLVVRVARGSKALSEPAEPRPRVEDDVVEDDVKEKFFAVLRAKNISVVEDASTDSSAGRDDSQVVAAVLLSDGAVWAMSARSAVERARAATGGAPVYVLTDEAVDGRARVALENVSVTRGASRGVPVAVRCFVHARGMRGRETLVTVADEAQVRASARLLWQTDDERQQVELEVVPKTAGWMNYVARAEAAGGEDDAATLSRAFALYTEERRLRVLFFEGEPTWEAKFIRRALDDANLFDVDYFAQVSRKAVAGVEGVAPANDAQGRDTGNDSADSGAKRAGTGSASPEARLRAVLADVSKLNAYDCLIVGATPNAFLSNMEAERLRGWVERRGGGLVVLGVNAFSGSVIAPNGKLYGLLPALVDAGGLTSTAQTIARNSPVESKDGRGSGLLTPTDAGAGGPLRGYLNAGESAKRGALTGEGLRLGQLRAGASVLAVSGLPNERGIGETGATLMAAAPDGMGRVLLFAPADSWRIRTSASGEQTDADSPFGALWQGIVLWSAAHARPPVEVVLDDESPAAASDVTAELRARDGAYTPLKILRANARLQPLAETSEEAVDANGAASAPAVASQEIAFTPDANDASLWRARFNAPPRGHYRLAVEYEANGQRGTAEKLFAVVNPTAMEPGAAFDTLARAALESGGELFYAEDIGKLADRLAAESQRTGTTRQVLDLRRWWPLAIIIPLLLSCEWLVLRISRRRRDIIQTDRAASPR